ncbi:MAG: hypothetical protein WDN06_12760 [Asticcacaulis sp.]
MNIRGNAGVAVEFKKLFRETASDFMDFGLQILTLPELRRDEIMPLLPVAAKRHDRFKFVSRPDLGVFTRQTMPDALDACR